MPGKVPRWESLSPAHRAGIAQACAADFLLFVAMFFTWVRSEVFRANWHHHLMARILMEECYLPQMPVS